MDPEAVSQAALTAMWSIDTAVDRLQQEVNRRAQAWLDTSYFAELTRGATPLRMPEEWTRHQVHTQITLAPNQPEGDTPPKTSGSTWTQWMITSRPIGRDGWHGTPLKTIAFVRLQRPGPAFPWRVFAVSTT